MRGGDVDGRAFQLEDRVRRHHPLWAIRLIVNDALGSLEVEFRCLIRRSVGARRHCG